MCEEEDVSCSRLMFKEDFLSDQYFGDNHPVSIITEKVHFGEGMHRRAFRTKLQAGLIPLSLPGHSCVLKVHNSISYGTKNSDELIQRNFSLAVEVRTSQDPVHLYLNAMKCNICTKPFLMSQNVHFHIKGEKELLNYTLIRLEYNLYIYINQYGNDLYGVIGIFVCDTWDTMDFPVIWNLVQEMQFCDMKCNVLQKLIHVFHNS